MKGIEKVTLSKIEIIIGQHFCNCEKITITVTRKLNDFREESKG